MLKHSYILLLAVLTLSLNIFGQNKLSDNLVPDSTIRQFKIKRVKEYGYARIGLPTPSYSNVELFDTTGRIERKTFLNNYYRFERNYSYNIKKNLISVTEFQYDRYSHLNDTENDSLIRTLNKKFNLTTKEQVDRKPSQLGQFRSEQILGNQDRLIQRSDTFKLVEYFDKFQYNASNQLVETRHFVKINQQAPALYAIDSLFYNEKHQKIKEINYFGFMIIENLGKHNQEIQTIFQYDVQGLLTEKKSTTIHLGVKNDIPYSTMSRYEYEFYSGNGVEKEKPTEISDERVKQKFYN